MIRRLSLASLAMPLLLATYSASADEYADAAEDVCACQEPVHEKSAELADAVKAAQATGNFAEIMRIQGEMMGMQGEIEACYAELEKTYPHFAEDQAKIDKVNDLAEKKCPNPVKGMMMGSGPR